jgi:hypothetical protein
MIRDRSGEILNVLRDKTSSNSVAAFLSVLSSARAALRTSRGRRDARDEFEACMVRSSTDSPCCFAGVNEHMCRAVSGMALVLATCLGTSARSASVAQACSTVTPLLLVTRVPADGRDRRACECGSAFEVWRSSHRRICTAAADFGSAGDHALARSSSVTRISSPSPWTKSSS